MGFALPAGVRLMAVKLIRSFIMKSFARFFALVAIVSSVSAQAIFRPGWERPIEKAMLEALDNQVSYPTAEAVTLHQQDGAEMPTMISLEEDTGIRCIMAPCPSQRTRQFRITDVTQRESGMIVYTAREILHPLPNVRMAARVLELIDFRHDVLADTRFLWSVRVKGPFSLQVRTYGGNPEPVITIQ